MSDVDQVLAAIDGALEGDTSADAMRWVPQEKHDDQVAGELGGQWRDAGWVSDDSWTIDDVARVFDVPADLVRIRQLTVAFQFDDEQREALRLAAEELIRPYQDVFRQLAHQITAAARATRSDYTLWPPGAYDELTGAITEEQRRRRALEARRNRNTGPPPPRLDRR